MRGKKKINPNLPRPLRPQLEMILRGLPRDAGQKWLGSMLTSRGSKLQDVDLQHLFQQASQVFHMNLLQDSNVSIVKRLRYFESIMSLVACFAGGHRTMYNRRLERLDTHFRKLCRPIVGPPPSTDSTLEWHEIFHQWNVRVNIFIDRTNIKPWSHICCLSCWRLAQYIATVPPERWVRRILRWCLAGIYRIGRPHFHWESKLESYCKYKGLGRWIFFFLAPFCRDGVSVSCFTGQLPGIGTVFILASLQMCKVQSQSPLASHGGWGGRRLEAAGSGGSCARRSLKVGSSPSRL